MDSQDCEAYPSLQSVKPKHQPILNDLALTNQKLDILCLADTTEVCCCHRPEHCTQQL
jgi:hypothetical protein